MFFHGSCITEFNCRLMIIILINIVYHPLLTFQSGTVAVISKLKQKLRTRKKVKINKTQQLIKPQQYINLRGCFHSHPLNTTKSFVCFMVKTSFLSSLTFIWPHVYENPQIMKTIILMLPFTFFGRWNGGGLLCGGRLSWMLSGCWHYVCHKNIKGQDGGSKKTQTEKHKWSNLPSILFTSLNKTLHHQHCFFWNLFLLDQSSPVQVFLSDAARTILSLTNEFLCARVLAASCSN